MAPPLHLRRRGAQDHAGIGCIGNGGAGGVVVAAGREDVEDEASAPPRIRNATKMTRRIQNTYGDPKADGRIMCRQCSERIVVGSAMRRVKRTGMCWHDECYMQAARGGRIPPKIRSVRVMSRRIKKLFGGGDDHSVLCQMCGTEVEIGMKMRRATGTRMCWHEQCYRMTWGECMRRAAAPRRPAYQISNSKWKRMLSECLECAGSRLCEYHRGIEAKYRVPCDRRKMRTGGVDGCDAMVGEAAAADAAGDATLPGTFAPAAAASGTAATVMG